MKQHLASTTSATIGGIGVWTALQILPPAWTNVVLGVLIALYVLDIVTTGVIRSATKVTVFIRQLRRGGDDQALDRQAKPAGQGGPEAA
jgi:hypothetical protein